MDVSQRSSSFTCIKPNAAHIVKLLNFPKRGRVGTLLLFITIQFVLNSFFVLPSHAAEESNPEPTLDSETEKPQNTKPTRASKSDEGDIEATTYSIEVVRRSNSNRVYLFDDKTNRQPKSGRILLLKKEDQPVMAFRVLRNYPDKRMFAAKRIKKYKNIRILEDGESFLTLEKVADFNIMPTVEDNVDLKEIESRLGLKISPYDPDLDKATSPPTREQEVIEEKNSELQNQEQEAQEALTIEESKTIDHYSHWLTGGFGYIRNNAPPATQGSYNFSSGNLRYGYTLGRQLLLDYPNLQDSLVAEAGIYIYKAINFAVQGDAYTVLTFAGSARYNLMFSEKFGVFIYAGFLRSQVQSNVSGLPEVIGSLTSTLPALGAGLLLQLGPSWYARADLGMDTMTLNLLLHF